MERQEINRGPWRLCLAWLLHPKKLRWKDIRRERGSSRERMKSKGNHGKKNFNIST